MHTVTDLHLLATYVRMYCRVISFVIILLLEEIHEEI